MRDQHPRVLFSCVAENRPAFATMAHSLALSIRGFAGALANAAIVVNFVDGVEPRFAAPLEALGVQLRTVPRVSAANPLANKLRMLELHAEHEFDVLVALDCDVIVVGDPSPWIDPGRIAAKAADFDRFDDDEWRRLFDVVRVPVLERTLTATATGQRTYPYFNSGVVLVPHDVCGRLQTAWLATFADLGTALAADPHLIRTRWQWLAEQASLSLAVLRAELPWTALPPEVNFPSHVPVPPGTLRGPPIVVHYHSERDVAGFLLRSRTPAIDPLIDRFNRRRAEVTGIPYGGLGRRSVPARLKRDATDRLWGAVVDSPWYDSSAARRVRSALKRAAPRGRRAAGL